MSGIEVNRNSNPDTSITYDDTAGEFRLERDGVVQSLEIDTLSVSSNVTKDTSGDLQIRDDSNGDIFSLDDGGSPQLAARYEGAGAFTVGVRTTTRLFDFNPPVVAGSIVIGGGSGANDAVGSGAVAIGNEVTLGGFYVADNSVGIGKNIDVSKSDVFVVGKDITDSSTSGGNVFLGIGLTTSFDGTTVVGAYNEDIQASAGSIDSGFLVGTGEDDINRETSLRVNSEGSYTSSLFLNNDLTLTSSGARASAVLGDPSGINNTASVESSLVMTEEINSGITIDDPVFQSLIIESSVSGGSQTDNVIAVDSDIQDSFIGGLSYYSTYTGISAGVLENSWLFDVNLNSDFDITDRANYNIVFGSNKTIKGNTRSNRLVLSSGNVNADNAVAIRGATVSTDNTVGIGNNTFIDTSNSQAFLVEDSGTNTFSVDTASTQITTYGGVIRGARNNVASNTFTASTDHYIGIDTASGAYTVTLSTTDAQDGREIVIHDQAGNASTNNITVDTEGTETINGPNVGFGNSSITIANSGDSATLRSDGTDWYIV